MVKHWRSAAGVAMSAWLISAAGGASALELTLPVACTVGRDCAVQQYVDHDPGPSATDYACGAETYEAHTGTDIRLPSLRAMEAGVDVLAAAAGTVARIRDGVEDRLYGGSGDAGVEGRECGNGVVVEHGDGWLTQYCHMRRGSIAVVPGQSVAAGARLGQVGLSGETVFPHLHFEVRQGERVVDPFDPAPASAAGAACVPHAVSEASLWSPAAAAALRYRAGTVLNVGFAAAPLSIADVETGATPTTLGVGSPAIVFFGRAINLKTGDRQRLELRGPDGDVLAEQETSPVERPKAQIFAFTGKKRTAPGWPAGRYSGRYAIVRDGAEIDVGVAMLTVR